MKIVKHSFDGIIVGAGGAGLRAAIEAAPTMKLAVITKLYPTRSHTGAAQGGMSAAIANVEEDNWNWHAFDTVKGSDYLADQPAVDILCKEAIDAVVELEHWGLPFSRLESGKIAQRRFGGHTIKEGAAPAFRACYAADINDGATVYYAASVPKAKLSATNVGSNIGQKSQPGNKMQKAYRPVVNVTQWSKEAENDPETFWKTLWPLEP